MIARLNLGGPAHQVCLLSGRRLDPARYETLLVHGKVAPGEASMADLAEREGAEAVYLPELAQPIDPASDVRALRRLAGIARRFRPDIVHTHTAKAGFLGRTVAARLGRRPVIVHTYHGHVLEGYFGSARTSVYRLLERQLGRRSDALIGVSQATVDDLVRLGIAPRERFRVIPLGLDLTSFARVVQLNADADADRSEVRRELGLEDSEVLLTYVGRIVPIKRLDLMIRAFARTVAETPSARLAIVGDGEERPALEQLAAGLGVSKRVSFLGYRRDLARIQAASDAAVLSSDNEGSAVSLIEAAAAGRPAVATAVGGVGAIVDADTGLLVEPGDEIALGRAMSEMAADAQMRGRRGEVARERVLRMFSIDRLIGDIDHLYQELIATSDHPLSTVTG